ncbi:MAG: diguanylate cyclase [Nitrospiraceae bacterium]|nr:MAG: diguanylate cyclase [Nitrospiraceae bacterium]
MHKILLLDKGDSSIHSFQSVLEKKGFTIVKARNLRDTLSYLKGNGIDLVVLDKNFSSQTGQFKKFINQTQHIPKIVLTKENNFRSITPLLKDYSSIPLREPVSFREFEYYVKKLMKDREIFGKQQELHDALITKEKELHFFEDITGILTSSLNLNRILAEIMKKTKAMIGAEAWSILLFDDEKKELHFEKTQGRHTKKVKNFRLKAGKGLAGWVAEKGEPAVVSDASKDKRFFKKMDSLLNFKTRSLMCIPIKIKDEVIGVLEIINKIDGTPFTKEDLELPLKLVSHAAVAIERALLYQKMEELSLKDDVTNLFNTRYLNRAIVIEIERSDRYGPPFTLIFMDIDSFKLINDQYGHIVGGKVLVEISQLLLNNLRTVDIVARYGGDEFVVVLPQTTPKSGFLIAERLRKAIERNEFLKSEGYSIKITASFGVASYPEDAKSKEDLFRIADEAMYRGKFSTKNIVYAAAQ